MTKIALGIFLVLALRGAIGRSAAGRAFNLVSKGNFFRKSFADYFIVSKRLAYRLNYRRHAVLPYRGYDMKADLIDRVRALRSLGEGWGVFDRSRRRAAGRLG